MIDNIQTLRAIAAILVVAFHSVIAAKSYKLSTDFFLNVDIWGAAGVDIFFIISGFIMVYIQSKKKKKPFEFMADRAERIIPLYWVLTFGIASLLIILPQAFRELQISTEFFLKSLFFISYFDNIHPILYVGWTLEYEMLFYVIFAITLFAKNLNVSVLISVIALSILVYLGLNNIVIEFIYGMLAGLFFNKFKIQLSNKIVLIPIVSGFILLIVNINSHLPRSINWGIPSLLVFIGFLYLKPIKNKILTILGNASYSIYLVQVFSIPICYKVFSKLPILNILFINELYVIVCCGVSVISGVLLHLMIEKPLANLIKNIKSRNRASSKARQNVIT